MESLYFEIHITIEPIDRDSDEFKTLTTLSTMHSFKPAGLFMQKRKEDTPERSKYDTFVTGHRQTMHEAMNDMIFFIERLKTHGFKVWRYKIEDVKLDSRDNDILRLLDKKEFILEGGNGPAPLTIESPPVSH